MTIEYHEQDIDFIQLTADVVSAYVSNNPVPVAELANLIARVHGAVIGLTTGGASIEAAAEIEQPTASQIRKSVTRDGIVSFIDGRIYKTLKRHLTSHDMTPASYRARYGLPVDYPMVAASYSETRSSLAKQIGLGQPGTAAENVRQLANKAA